MQGSQAGVLLAAGQWAQAQAKFSPDVAGPGENGRQCEPTAHALRVTFGTATVTAPMDPTPVCEHGTLQFGPFAAVKQVPACTSSVLAATLTLDTGGSLATYTIGLRNTTTAACYTGSMLGVRLLGGTGSQPLPTKVSGGVSAPYVVGSHARAIALATLDTTPARGEPKPCALAFSLQLSLSPAGGTLLVPIKPPVHACHRGAITLSSLSEP
jgi:hypothetical protein